MGNGLITINANNIVSSRKYKEIGENTELQITYKSNGTDYAIETLYGEKYTLTGSTVESISAKTSYNIEEVMDILYIVYDAYENYKTYVETTATSEAKLGSRSFTRKLQDKMVDTISDLLRKYSYEDVKAYFTSMKPLELMTLFNGQDDRQVLDRLHSELKPIEVYRTPNGEPEELVSKAFN